MNEASPAYKRWTEAIDELERLNGGMLDYESPKLQPEQWLDFWVRQFRFWRGSGSAPLMRYVVDNLKKAKKGV